MSTFQIKNRWFGNTIFECELSAEVENESLRVKLGFAVKAAIRSGADLRDAVLSGADLRGAVLSDADLSDADLSGADLRDAVLRDADLSGADLRDAVLSGADLRGAVLSDADLSGADLRDAVLSGAVLSGAVLSGADLRGVPVIKDIHQSVYAAASQPDALDMGTWHTCETTHCRAGWVTHLAGEGGAAMDFCLGTPAAAALIYLASDPEIGRIPDFYASNEDALSDMRRLAEQEAAKAQPDPAA